MSEIAGLFWDWAITLLAASEEGRERGPCPDLDTLFSFLGSEISWELALPQTSCASLSSRVKWGS